MSPSSPTLELGTLFQLPREIRDRIYGYALYFEIPNQAEPTCLCQRSPKRARREPKTRTGLLRASRRIHEEARKVLFQVNEFTMWIERDWQDRMENCSITGEIGFGLQMSHSDIFEVYGDEANLRPIPFAMLPYLQNLNISIGSCFGLREVDIVRRPMHISGPERPTYVTLLTLIDKVCERILKKCHQLHLLRISIRSIEEDPGSIEEVMKPLIALRNIKHTIPVVYSMRYDRGEAWFLKASYARYMHKVMAMPEGAVAPKYVGDEQDPDQREDDIFEIMDENGSAEDEMELFEGSDYDFYDFDTAIPGFLGFEDDYGLDYDPYYDQLIDEA